MQPSQGLNRIEEYLGLWIIIALLNSQTSLSRLRRIIELAQNAVLDGQAK